MLQVRSNSELASLHAAGEGLVFNYFTKSGSDTSAGQNNVLHVADCFWVNRMLAGARLTARPSVDKIFFDSASEAQSWLIAHVGQETVRWKRCAICCPS